MSHWQSPYEDLPKDRRFAVNFDVDVLDHRLIKSVACTHGSITKFLQTIYHDVAEYARANDLSVVDSDTFINYLRQRADSRFAANSHGGPGRVGSSGVHQDPPHSPRQSSGVSETTPNRRRSKGAKD